MSKALVALLVLGLIGGCLGVFDNSETPVPTTGAVVSTTVIGPVELPWTTIRQLPSAVVSSTVAESAVSVPRPETAGSAVDEIDCEQAEELADWGDYEAGDIADYCDYGPDPGDLPDEFDWDE